MNQNDSNGSISMPKSLFDCWQLKLKPTTFSVLCSICIQLYVLKREYTTAKELIALTGLSRSAVYNCLRELESREIISQEMSYFDSELIVANRITLKILVNYE